ncbi:HAMP domain-containing protein [Pandoraea nosoerga]|uniref:histidine kinase n=1 Tax=Pandoraea nosoerga TaxID=2508296 RepID=A0A5E4SBI3_9BURK|nr:MULTISPECIES: ATP-binding protein [Pandoraea]MBN4666953.1 HAMP domain-containing protein [Pandoraea nosoerga]MBN4674832.1 HAMP domain-containing protein [Pandoraea nosoerga]MBN4681811.1 HAMP domain-containing protein [Pandoraea nosoerga]MBN4744127.1 HAMP domain-containing protein [Pandoraea nosoerga]VVD72433.1 two-component sensor histidine kinase [Pandoraea nosoerga]
MHPIRMVRGLFGGLFWRTFFLIALLIGVSLAAWYQSFRVIEREPRAQRVAQQLVSIVKLTRTALLYSEPDLRRALLQDLESNEGIRVYPREPADKVEKQPGGVVQDLIVRDVQRRLGTDTVIAAAVNEIPAMWISFKIDEDDYWVAIEQDRIDTATGLQLFSWGTFALALSLLGAAFITALVNRPFARLAHAARAIGEGQRPDPLPERGMGEAAEANRSFNQMVQELERLEADRALMLAGISHDLRTPLARLRLETEMSPSDESVKRDMISDIEQMDEIIGRFLDYARPASRTMQSLDLSDIARETAAAFDAREDLKVTVELADSAPVLAERTDLKRLLTNLIENARKYGRDPQTNIANVLISTRVLGERVEMRVRDTGPGIPEDQLALVFRPFYRVDTARTKAEGTGLGMAIVQRIASRYKGHASLRNVRPGTGLEIIVSFPLAK